MIVLNRQGFIVLISLNILFSKVKSQKDNPPSTLTINDYSDIYECENEEFGRVTRPCMCGRIDDWEEVDVSTPMVASASQACTNGFAGNYPCSGVNLMSFIPLSVLNSASGSLNDQANDCWGWTDTTNNKEYAIIGVQSGTSYVDITDPVNPIYIGKLPSKSGSSLWGDIKTYMNHAYIVSENSGQGMQVLDLTTLKNVSPGSVLTETTHYSGFANCHNIVINEESGFAYAVGTNTCSGGLHMIDITNPANPTSAGCYSGDGYTHDAQCVIYNGSSSAFVGREICFAENEDTVTIVDVTDKSNPVLLSKKSYPNVRYTHQGWLTEDHNYLLIGDELDEKYVGVKTTTIVLNVMDITNPQLAGLYTAATDAIDHNLYVKGNYVYQANYRAGLRILEMDDISTASFNEVGYFDIYPNDDSNSFNGAWSNYPYFPSGSIIVSGIEQGLFVLRTGTMTSSPTQAPVTPSPTASCQGSSFELNLLTDNYGSETSWVLKKGSESVLTGSGYSSNTAYTAEKCLSNGDYIFTITDSYGDGICCSYGSGSYEISVDGDVIKNGGQFTTSEDVTFTVGGGSPVSPPSPSPTKSPTKSPTSSPTPSPSTSPTVAPVSPPTTPPTSAPVSPPTTPPTPAPVSPPTTPPTLAPVSSPTNPAPCKDLEVKLTTDKFGSETSWELINDDSDAVVHSGGPYDNESLYTITNCIPEGSYTFLMKDSEGDGMCCDHGSGSYTLTLDGVVIHNGNGEFGSEERIMFQSPSVPCSTLDIEVKTDIFFSETSWDLKDGSRQIILSSGQGYDTSNSVNTAKQCLIPGRYTFSIFDSFGDGLCCGHGSGYYKLKSNGVVIHSGGEFASQDAVTLDVTLAGVVVVSSNVRYLAQTGTEKNLRAGKMKKASLSNAQGANRNKKM